jgi:hypothetical protein
LDLTDSSPFKSIARNVSDSTATLFSLPDKFQNTDTPITTPLVHLVPEQLNSFRSLSNSVAAPLFLPLSVVENATPPVAAMPLTLLVKGGSTSLAQAVPLPSGKAAPPELTHVPRDVLLPRVEDMELLTASSPLERFSSSADASPSVEQEITGQRLKPVYRQTRRRSILSSRRLLSLNVCLHLVSQLQRRLLLSMSLGNH